MSSQIQNAAEAIHALTEDAAALKSRLSQLTATVQQSSSANVASASQHLALYQEVVQTLQANTTAAIQCSADMQQECQTLYHEFSALDVLATDVHQLRTRVEKLEACVTSKVQGN